MFHRTNIYKICKKGHYVISYKLHSPLQTLKIKNSPEPRVHRHQRNREKNAEINRTRNETKIAAKPSPAIEEAIPLDRNR